MLDAPVSMNLNKDIVYGCRFRYFNHVPGCSVCIAHCFVKFCSITRVCITYKVNLISLFIVYEMIFVKYFFESTVLLSYETIFKC